MYLAGVSVRRVEDITEALWGTRVSPSTVSNLNKKIYAKIEAWRNRPIVGEHPYVFLDGIVMKRTWAGEVRNVSLLVAIGVNGEGFREILGICEGAKEDKSGWAAFLAPPRGPRAEGRGADRLGRLSRPRRERRGVPAGRPVAALRRRRAVEEPNAVVEQCRGFSVRANSPASTPKGAQTGRARV
jgi:hypothetical protein